MYKVIKTAVLLAGLFTFVGCGSGACCESDLSVSKGDMPVGVSGGDPITTTGKPSLEPTGEITIVPVITVNENNNSTITVSPCEELRFDSNESKGVDENSTYNWSFYQGCELSDKSSFKYKFAQEGEYNVTLTISDNNQSFIDWVLIKVKKSCK